MTPTKSPQRIAPLKKTKRKNVDLEFELLEAAANYIEFKGGKVIVIGGIQIQHWPGDMTYNYHLNIKFTGKIPNKKAQDD